MPIISFTVLRGVCRTCEAPIDGFHLAGELVGAVITITAFMTAPDLRAGLLTAMGLLLLASAIHDAKTRRLPDMWTLAIGVTAGVLAALRSLNALLIGLAAAVIVGVLLVLLRLIYRRARGRDGLGLGDVKLLAALALWLGVGTSWALVAASVLALAYIAIAKPRAQFTPFGPAIAAGAWMVGILGEGRLWPMALP